MRKQNVFWIVGICALVVTAVAFYRGFYVSNKNSDIYETTLISYLEAMKTGTKDAVEYASFPNEDIRNAFLSSPMYIVDYEIETSETINKSLRAYTILIKDSMSVDDTYRRIYYFVGVVNDQYTVFGNVDFIPDSLSESLDVSKYSYTDENLLGTPEFAP